MLKIEIFGHDIQIGKDKRTAFSLNFKMTSSGLQNLDSVFYSKSKHLIYNKRYSKFATKNQKVHSGGS